MSAADGVKKALQKALEASRGVPRSMDSVIAEEAARKVPFGVSIGIVKTTNGAKVTYSSDRLNKGALSMMAKSRGKKMSAAGKEAAMKQIKGGL